MNLLADMLPHCFAGRGDQRDLPANLQLSLNPLRIVQLVDDHLVFLGAAGILLQLSLLSFAESLAAGNFFQHVQNPFVFDAHAGIIPETAIYLLGKEDFFESTKKAKKALFAVDFDGLAAGRRISSFAGP